MNPLPIQPAQLKELTRMRDIALREHGPAGRSTRWLQQTLEACTQSTPQDQQQKERKEALLDVI